MSSAEFAEWRAFQRLEGPLGPQREDWRAAMVASVIANAQRDSKKHPRPYEPHQFVPDWAGNAGVPRRRPPPAEVADKVKAAFQGLAARARGRH